MRRRWLIDAEDPCARRFSISKIVIHEQRGSCLGQGGRNFGDVESKCVDGVSFIFVTVGLVISDSIRFSFAENSVL